MSSAGEESVLGQNDIDSLVSVLTEKNEPRRQALRNCGCGFLHRLRPSLRRRRPSPAPASSRSEPTSRSASKG